MKFAIGHPPKQNNPSYMAFLEPDNWDDWFQYETLYYLVIFDENSRRIDAGGVKIGEISQSTRKPAIPSNFDFLDSKFFSLGQNENYYEAIYSLSSNIRNEIFCKLRDCAYDLSIFKLARNEKVMEISLLRSIDPETVANRFNRIAHGNAMLTKFQFSYELPVDQNSIPLSLVFSVKPDSNPPTNIHVLIGRNGVGKTRCFRLMSLALRGNHSDNVGIFKSIDNKGYKSIFANLVSVAFSAFDQFDPLPDGEFGEGVKYAYIGLRHLKNKQDITEKIRNKLIGKIEIDNANYLAEAVKEIIRVEIEGDRVILFFPNDKQDIHKFVSKKANLSYLQRVIQEVMDRQLAVHVQHDCSKLDEKSMPTKTPEELTNEFVNSLSKCSSGPRVERWRGAISILATDPLFEEADVIELLQLDSNIFLENDARSIFNKLSSGHKIVLLTITRLVELVDERTLVLIDEPEAHLHPPLLAAFVRALSFLLIKRNGVAIIATHSPVVLQETPKSCVWVISRSGSLTIANRPEIETFGENVGILTREVFGLEVTHSGFHRLIREAVSNIQTYEELLGRFDNQLGAEARAIAKALIALRTFESDHQ